MKRQFEINFGGLLYTTVRLCFVLAATGAGWAVYYCVIVEG